MSPGQKCEGCVNYKAKQNPYFVWLLTICAGAVLSITGYVLLTLTAHSNILSGQQKVLEGIQKSNASMKKEFKESYDEVKEFMKEPQFTEKNFEHRIQPLKQSIELLSNGNSRQIALLESLNENVTQNRIDMSQLKAALSDFNNGKR